METCIVEQFENEHVAIFTLGKPCDFRSLYRDASPERTELCEYIAQIAAPYAPSTITVPHVYQFNALVLPHEQFIPTDTYHDISFALGTGHADGVALARAGDAALIVTGDCPTVVLWGDEHGAPVIAMHAGRESLHNLYDHHPAGIESIVDAGMAHFDDPKHVHARIIAGIASQHFTHDPQHPEHSDKNQKLIGHITARHPVAITGCNGNLDLPILITEQLIANGVPRVHGTHDNLDTYNDPRLWSHRAGDTGRNGILVIRK